MRLVPNQKTLLMKTVFFDWMLLLDIYPNLPEVDAITKARKVTKLPTVKWVKQLIVLGQLMIQQV